MTHIGRRYDVVKSTGDHDGIGVSCFYSTHLRPLQDPDGLKDPLCRMKGETLRSGSNLCDCLCRTLRSVLRGFQC